MSDAEIYTLDQLQSELGVPTELQAKANAPREPDAELVRLGAQIASARVLTDVEGLYGLAYAFWLKATDPQKDHLIGFSEGVLRYAVDRAIALRTINADTIGTGFIDAAEVKRRRALAAKAFSEGISFRDHAKNVLRKAAPDEATMQKITSAVGTAEDDEKLVAALERLAAIGEKLLATEDEVAKTRLSEVRLTQDFVTQLSKAAEKVRKTAKDAAVRINTRRVVQGDIDLLDGVNLVLLREIIYTFEDAHEKDPSIPRLVPTSTRRLLGSRNRG